MPKNLEAIKDFGKIGLKTLRNGLVVFGATYFIKEGFDYNSNLDSLKESINYAQDTGIVTSILTVSYYFVKGTIKAIDNFSSISEH
ncbi:MAG: hypothetical protein WC812_02735 [Candidatus Pacearchaeota archaeon]|jgi:hypothetical protein